jgi:predicted  nucleic acid-binding Zn-ribbon protein
MFGRALAAERSARQWRDYASNLETQVKQLKTKLSSIEQERNRINQLLGSAVEKFHGEQIRAVAFDALQNKLAEELAKVSPNNPLASKEFRIMVVARATKDVPRPRQVKLQP